MFFYLNLKSIIPFIYLLLLPYQYIKSIIFILIFITLNKNRRIYLHTILKNVRNNIVFIIYLILGTLYTSNNYSNIEEILGRFLCIPYFLKYNVKKDFNFMLKIYYVSFKLPEYIIKSITINILHIILTTNLSVITTNEILLNSLKILINHQYQIKKNSYYLLLLTFLTSYEIIEKILLKFQNLYVGLKSKNYISLNNLLKYINYFLDSIAQQVVEESYLLMLTIWNRT
uniref:Uncharacterized protein n=1 Tax=Leptosiphonia brodiei TaxID=2608611 RepID=A0A1Z1M9V0_9FLOR|nr:hypothetical protein [Leptosiphonia brodiei]ARW62888.1 hypothetical protein [Leptosiphonia brodiei]